jgi:hypothetical protein
MDSHNASTPPSVGSSFGVTDDNEKPGDSQESVDEPLTPEDVLLYVAMGTGGAAVLLLLLLAVRRSDEPELAKAYSEQE